MTRRPTDDTTVMTGASMPRAAAAISSARRSWSRRLHALPLTWALAFAATDSTAAAQPKPVVPVVPVVPAAVATPNAPLSPVTNAAPAMAAQPALPDFTGLVEHVGPAVVNIRTESRVHETASSGGGGEADGDLADLLRRFGIPMPEQTPSPHGTVPRKRQSPTPPGSNPGPNGNPNGSPRSDPSDPNSPPNEDELQPTGVGSGFILDADGYVMTNAHVVDGADEVIVTLTDKREFKARIIGVDKRTDVALVKVEATGLPWVKIGDVGRLKVGEWVIAIGSPFNLDNTVTAGIVSAKARDTGDFLPFIQTDVAINPGNSGGPLINMRGEVVGVNSQIYSRSGGFMGISFAIPIDEASRVADQLRTKGRVVRGRIGVQIDSVGKEVAESIGLGKPTGALVRSVEPGGPAEKAGIEPGDIITRFDGHVIDKAGDLPRAASSATPGGTASVQVFHRGAMRDLKVGVVEFEPETVAAAKTPNAPGGGPVAGALGLVVSDVDEAMRRELKLKAGGALVQSVDGPALHAGVREGDVLLALNNVEIGGARQFQAIAAKADRSKPVNLLLKRGEWVNYVVIHPAR